MDKVVKVVPISEERLKELLKYDQSTGEFFWIVRQAQRTLPGTKAGSRNGDGYWQLRICGKNYLAHRLAWFYMKGQWPVDQLDHINGIRGDNRLENLREADLFVNAQNQRGAKKSSKTRRLGVCPSGNRFLAKIQSNKKTYYLGSFKTQQEASDAYLEAKRKLHQGCTI